MQPSGTIQASLSNTKMQLGIRRYLVASETTALQAPIPILVMAT